ncbi:MAG: hypothetical protein HFE64_06135 [Lachnospiraceae bacterium]|jgi:sporulation integral membrane protein YlbJ|nr:hypothetical protein [Lachnospiraceae bacterium]
MMFIIKKRIMLIAGVILFLVFLMLQPAKAMEGVKQGLVLWYQVVLPSQLPFVVCINLLLQLQNFFCMPPRIFTFISGMISGYPVGSMTAAQLFQQKQIPRDEVTALAALCNMAGPLFVIGTLGVGLLENVYYGYMLLLIQWAGAAVLTLLFTHRRFRIQNKRHPAKRENQTLPAALPQAGLGRLLGDAVGNAAELMLKVAGFIALFSVMLQWIPGYLGSFLEMTNGLRLIAVAKLPIKWKLTACSFLLNFSGLCVILQSLSAAEKAPVAAGRYVMLKILQGGTAAAMTLVICQILGM